MDGLPNLEELIKNLRHQLALYRQLVDLLRDEKEHIVSVRLKEVREATYSKEALLDEIHREEFRRRRWVAELAPKFGLAESDLTIEIIAAKYLPLDQRDSLLSVKAALIHMVKKAKEMNEDNRRLVQNALRDAELMKRNVLGLSGDNAQTYGPKGNMGAGPRDQSARLLSKEF